MSSLICIAHQFLRGFFAKSIIETKSFLGGKRPGKGCIPLYFFLVFLRFQSGTGGEFTKNEVCRCPIHLLSLLPSFSFRSWPSNFAVSLTPPGLNACQESLLVGHSKEKEEGNSVYRLRAEVQDGSTQPLTHAWEGMGAAGPPMSGAGRINSLISRLWRKSSVPLNCGSCFRKKLRANRV